MNHHNENQSLFGVTRAAATQMQLTGTHATTMFWTCMLLQLSTWIRRKSATVCNAGGCRCCCALSLMSSQSLVKENESKEKTKQTNRLQLLSISTMNIDEAAFAELGRVAARHKHSGSEKVTMRRFKSHFGSPPAVVADSWELILEGDVLRHSNLLGSKPANPAHLLWAMMLLKMHTT